MERCPWQGQTSTHSLASFRQRHVLCTVGITGVRRHPGSEVGCAAPLAPIHTAGDSGAFTSGTLTGGGVGAEHSKGPGACAQCTALLEWPSALQVPPTLPAPGRPGRGRSVLAWWPLTLPDGGPREGAPELRAHTCALSDPSSVLPPWGRGLWAQQRESLTPLPV